ncbi:MAG: heavy-metal-associated domain-containing protein, partial [Candidatus Onthomonas sp.]
YCWVTPFYSYLLFIHYTSREVMTMAKASASFALAGVDGKHDVKTIKRELDALSGVLSVSVSIAGSGSSSVAVDFDTTGVQSEDIAEKLQKMGYQILDEGTERHIM